MGVRSGTADGYADLVRMVRSGRRRTSPVRATIPCCAKFDYRGRRFIGVIARSISLTRSTIKSATKYACVVCPCVIARAGELYKKAAEKESSVAVVKVARPQQDARYDLPVIGKGTLKSVHKAGFDILAFEAGKTLVMDLDEVIALADKLNICLVAV